MGIEIRIEGLDELRDELENGFLPRVRIACFRAVRAAVDLGAAEARRLVPVSDKPKPDGVHLRDRIVGRIIKDDGDEVVGTISAERPYASFVEEGTKPHEIRPRRASVLAWESGGEQRFATKVNHPGTRSQPFMGPAYLKAERVLEARLNELLDRAADHFNSR